MHSGILGGGGMDLVGVCDRQVGSTFHSLVVSRLFPRGSSTTFTILPNGSTTVLHLLPARSVTVVSSAA
jgi:hypothetical protein